MKLRHLWLLLFIFILALMLRVYDLQSFPKELHVDEVNVGFQGDQLIRTGQDIFGNTLPLYIDRFGDYRPAGIFYFTGIFTSLFQLDIFFTRFPTALTGALSIFPLFFLTLFVSKNKNIAIIATFLLTISPWHIVASRATSESITALFLVISGVALFLFAIEKKKAYVFLVAGFLLLSSYLFYHTPRAFIPVFLLFTTFLIYRNPASEKVQNTILKKNYLIAFLLLVWVASLGISFTKGGIGRFEQTSLFTNPQLLQKARDLQDGEEGNIVKAKIFHNKVVVFGKEIIDQYFSYFSTQFLYIRGGLPSRYVVNDAGLFYYVEFPLLLVGLVFLCLKRPRFFFIPIVWIFCGPLAASLTLEDSPNIQRSLFMLPSFQIIEAYGLYSLFLKSNGVVRRVLFLTLPLLFLINITYFLHQYFTHLSLNESFVRQSGNRELFSYLAEHEDKYDAIYLPVYDDMPMYYAFFRQGKAEKLSIPRSQYNKEATVGKYIFVPYECPVKVFENKKPSEGERLLVVQYPQCRDNPKELVFITGINREDNTAAYLINEYVTR